MLARHVHPYPWRSGPVDDRARGHRGTAAASGAHQPIVAQTPRRLHAGHANPVGDRSNASHAVIFTLQEPSAIEQNLLSYRLRRTAGAVVVSVIHAEMGFFFEDGGTAAPGVSAPDGRCRAGRDSN